ncbi:trypsin-like peptidase domain-containing protein [Candidatus Nomurabacteria bacterium]|nr:trypsin-like peptidase domain-containing protein [Candidatus Nomurabacteria bacterium]
MRKSLAIIIVSTIFGGLFGSYLTVHYLDRLPWSEGKDLGQIIKSEVFQLTEESSVIDVVKKASPSVVSVVIKKDISKTYDPFQNFFNFGWPFSGQEQSNNAEPNIQKVGGGSGFIISDDGLILTNKHVVADANAQYSVILNDNTEYEAKVIGTDAFNDIGILKIEAKDLPVIELGDSDHLVIGQNVVAIGNALAEFSNTVTSGVVSGIGRSIVAGDGTGSSEQLEDVIQTDAAINPGNSGGPLLNLAGQVVGINTAVSQQGQLIGFAIPINSAKKIIEGVIESGEIVRPYLGVRYLMLNENIAKSNNLSINHGALIVRGDARTDLAIIPGSPADKANLRENDIILEVNDELLDEKNNLAKVIAKYQPGDKLKLKIWSQGEEKTTEVILEKYST